MGKIFFNDDINNNKDKRGKKEINNGKEHFFEVPQGYEHFFKTCSFKEFKEKYDKHIIKKIDGGEIEYSAIWCDIVYPKATIRYDNGSIVEMWQNGIAVIKKEDGRSFVSKDVKDMMILTTASQELGINNDDDG